MGKGTQKGPKKLSHNTPFWGPCLDDFLMQRDLWRGLFFDTFLDALLEGTWADFATQVAPKGTQKGCQNDPKGIKKGVSGKSGKLMPLLHGIILFQGPGPPGLEPKSLLGPIFFRTGFKEGSEASLDRILTILGSPWGPLGDTLGMQKATFWGSGNGHGKRMDFGEPGGRGELAGVGGDFLRRIRARIFPEKAYDASGSLRPGAAYLKASPLPPAPLAAEDCWLGDCWEHFGSSWRRSGGCWAHSGDSWGHFGDSRGPSGALWRLLGTFWGPSGDSWGPSGGLLGTHWAPLEAC